MNKILIGLTLLVSISSFAETKLDCYEKYHIAIEAIDTGIIEAYDSLYETEAVVLDQYFNPGKYHRGAHNPYTSERKQLLFSERRTFKNWIETMKQQSREYSRELTTCLKHSE